jgi:hypothetical protein
MSSRAIGYAIVELVSIVLEAVVSIIRGNIGSVRNVGNLLHINTADHPRIIHDILSPLTFQMVENVLVFARVLVTNNSSSGMDERVYLLLIHTTSNYT